MKKNSFLLMVMLLALSLVLAACNFGGEEAKTLEDGTSAKELNVVIPSEPASLHPQLAKDSTSGVILQNVFEGLTTFKDDKVVNAVAKDVKVSEDQLTYTFTLRDDAKWSNGDSVTAEDFEYAWEWALNPTNASEYASIFYSIKGAKAYNLGKGSVEDLGIEVVGEKTLEVTLENPTPYFLELTAFKTYLPIHKASADADAKWYTNAGETYVTNGPFTLADWQHNSSITLKKNVNYWDVGNVALDKVNISMVENESTAVTMFDAGDIDYLGAPFQTVSLDSIDRYKEEGILKIEDLSAVYWYKFNTTGKFTSNANIRKALTLAIDRQALIDHVIKGGQTPALGMVPSTVKGFEEDRGYYKDYNIVEAKKALKQGMEELGISDPSEIKIGLSIYTSEAHATIAQFIQEGWYKNLGIEVTIDNSELQAFFEKVITLDFDAIQMAWVADYNDAYSFLEPFDSVENGNNFTGWENAKYTELLKQSQVETDSNKRIKLLKQAEAIAMSEFPIAPIYYFTNLHVNKDYVVNMEPDSLGNVYLKYVDINK